VKQGSRKKVSLGQLWIKIVEALQTETEASAAMKTSKMSLTCTPRSKISYDWRERGLKGSKGVARGFRPRIAMLVRSTTTTAFFLICAHDQYY